MYVRGDQAKKQKIRKKSVIPATSLYYGSFLSLNQCKDEVNKIFNCDDPSLFKKIFSPNLVTDRQKDFEGFGRGLY